MQERKELGAFYTPHSLADLLASTLLSLLTHIAATRYVTP